MNKTNTEAEEEKVLEIIGPLLVWAGCACVCGIGGICGTWMYKIYKQWKEIYGYYNRTTEENLDVELELIDE